MITCDTECTYWDQVSLNNTNSLSCTLLTLDECIVCFPNSPNCSPNSSGRLQQDNCGARFCFNNTTATRSAFQWVAMHTFPSKTGGSRSFDVRLSWTSGVNTTADSWTNWWLLFSRQPIRQTGVQKVIQKAAGVINQHIEQVQYRIGKKTGKKKNGYQIRQYGRLLCFPV